MAVGSHGRGDRAPHSDLDLVLLHRSRRDVATVADRIWYPIWDRGIGLDHSVRTVAEAVDAAGGDLKVALGLLDARHVAGDPRLSARLTACIGSLWRVRARQWVPEVRAAAQERHDRFGEIAFLLEPDVKEGRGGLRDIAVLRSLQRVTTVLGDLLPALDGPAADLHAVRCAVHLHAGRATDRLLLQDQDDVAAALDVGDADALLGRVSAAARTVSYVWDRCWRRVDGWLGARATSETRPLGMGIALRDGEVHVHDPARWLAAAAAAADRRAPLATSTLERLVDALPRQVPDPWPYGWRQSFVALLGAGRHAVPVLEALDHHGLLVRLLPEWEAVRYKPQRNAYHRFTVDRHLMETAANAAALTRQVARPDLLLLGALLHDIGKGWAGRRSSARASIREPAPSGGGSGDHTVEGMTVVRCIAARMGLSPDDVETLVAMVEHHLLLPAAATRRDIDDPATVGAVAAAVRTPARLELLHALTQADSLATGPSAWSPWKASLVERLVQRVAAAMAGMPPPPEPDVSDLVPEGAGDGLHVVDGGRRCVVVAPDRPGLFSHVAGVLAMCGVDVLAATAGSAGDGRAVEVFDVQGAFGDEPDWERVRRHLDVALSSADTDAIGEAVARRARTYARRRLAAPARVIVDNDASARATVVEVRAPDDVGVLYRITKAIAAEGLDIRSARASTLGHEVVDAFYVVDRDGGDGDGDGDGKRVTDPARLDRLREAILDELGGQGWRST